MARLSNRGNLKDPPSRHPTFDHFLPSPLRGARWGLGSVAGHRAGRMVCRSCNGLRADAGHCVAALTCYAAVVGTWDEAELRPAMLRLMRRARARADRDAAWDEAEAMRETGA